MILNFLDATAYTSTSSPLLFTEAWCAFPAAALYEYLCECMWNVCVGFVSLFFIVVLITVSALTRDGCRGCKNSAHSKSNLSIGKKVQKCSTTRKTL